MLEMDKGWLFPLQRNITGFGVHHMKRITVAVLGILLLTAQVFASAASPEFSVYWPWGQALPVFPEVEELDVVDVSQSPGDIKIFMATLQGIVNRSQPRIYLIEGTMSEGKTTWLEDLGVPYVFYEDTAFVGDAVLQKYRDEITGMIIYDPDEPHSINVATTLAGIHDAVVVSPQLAEMLAAEPFNLPVVDDLQGRFQGKLDAYTWQFEHLWDQTSDRMLIGLSPGTSVASRAQVARGFETIAVEETQERASRNRAVYELDLSSALGSEAVYLMFSDALPQDGWGAAVRRVTVTADGETIADFIAGTAQEIPYLYDQQDSQVSSGFGGHRFADNNRYFIYRFTPPEGTEKLVASVDMWNQFWVGVSNVRPMHSSQLQPYGFLRDYAVANRAMVFWLDANAPEERALFEKILASVHPGTAYLGWFSNDVVGEFSGVELTSRYGVFVLAADWFNNLTVFSGTRPESVPARPEPDPTLENKIYVTFVFGEGDNLQYNQHRMRAMWDNPHRGEIPLNWTSSPLLWDAAPAILNYYHATATENDLLVAGPSGGGYFYPNVWPETVFSAFMWMTSSYLQQTGMPIPYVLNRMNGHNIPLSDSVVQAYLENYNPPGLFLSWENRSQTYVSNGMPISVIHGVGSVQEGIAALNAAKADWDGESPRFVSIGLLAWNLTPEHAVKMVENLGPEYEVVLADEYFALMRKAFNLPKHVQD